ncbi:MAG: hypothetical protein R2764_24150 [Bacteroidales bacterium]
MVQIFNGSFSKSERNYQHPFSADGYKSDIENDTCLIHLISENSLNPSHLKIKQQALELLAEKDDEILERYLEGETLNWETIEKKLSKWTSKQLLIPTFCGAAKRAGTGMEEILDGIVKLLPDAPKIQRLNLLG